MPGRSSPSWVSPYRSGAGRASTFADGVGAGWRSSDEDGMGGRVTYRATLTLMALLLALPAAAQERPSAEAARTSAAPTVDGALDEPLWRDCPRSEAFVERKPRLRAEPPVRTVFAVCYDQRALYIGIWLDDDHPDEILGLTRTRDSFTMFRDDAISVKLDPALDGRTTLGFVLNPAGARMDYRGIDESEFRVEFDTVWEGAAQTSASGWTAEMAIPWEALGIDPNNPPSEVGLNLSRDHPRRNATYDWALMVPPYSPISASRYGRLRGLDGLRTSTGADIATQESGVWALTPHVSGGFRRSEGHTTEVFNVGIDASGLGGGWRGQLTANTDFAQVDLDDQVVNLTRFGLFLPEKRDFFLTDLEVFTFGTSGRAQLLHTRRIGLGPEGEQLSILAGLKLVARPLDALRVGLLEVVTRPGDVAPWTSSLIARGVVELGGGSNVGVILSHRQSLDVEDDRNTAIGVDGAWRGKDIPILLTAFAMMSLTGADAGDQPSATGGRSTTLDPDEPAPGAAFSVSWRDELVRPTLRYAWFHEGLRADLGFFRRADVHEVDASVTVEPRLGRAGIEKITIDLNGDLVATGAADDLLDYGASAAATLSWEAGYWLGIEGVFANKTVQSAFTVGEDTPVSEGAYDSASASIFFGTPGVYPVSFEVVGSWGQYFGGQLLSANAAVTARPAALIRIEAAGSWAWATFGDDSRPDFHSGVVNGRVTLGFTPDLGLSVFAGWNHIAGLAQLQSRLRFSYLPGSELYLVYQLDLDADNGSPQFQSVVLKATVHWP